MAERPTDPADDAEPGPRPSPRQSDAESAGWYKMAGVGFEFVVAVALFGALGWWLDRTFHTAPWLLIAGCGVGFAAGLWQMVRVAGRMFKD